MIHDNLHFNVKILDSERKYTKEKHQKDSQAERVAGRQIRSGYLRHIFWASTIKFAMHRNCSTCIFDHIVLSCFGVWIHEWYNIYHRRKQLRQSSVEHVVTVLNILPSATRLLWRRSLANTQLLDLPAHQQVNINKYYRYIFAHNPATYPCFHTGASASLLGIYFPY